MDELGNVTAKSREGHEFHTLGVLTEQATKWGLRSVVFDGEICILRADGMEDFTAIQKQYNKKDKDNQNNLLILSWTTHQCFDGLNLVTKQHMVPSIAIQFVEFQGRETLEFTSGYPFQKDKVAISVESPDPKVLESIGMLLKAGNSVVKGKLLTYVHVDSCEEFKKFLTIKYMETTRLWKKHLPLGSLLSEGEVVETGRPKRIRKK